MNDRQDPYSVSVIVTTYNRAPFLRKCLQEVMQLRYPSFEVLVVDGPSTDETEEVLEDFPRVHRFKTESRNISISRNIGLRAARGEVAAFVDDDAEVPPDWLHSLTRCFEDARTGGVGGVVRGEGDRIDFANGVVDLYGRIRAYRPTPGHYNDPARPLFNSVMGTNCAFRRSALFEIGLFDENYDYYHDEADVCLRMIRAGWRIRHCPGASVLHRSAPGPNRQARLDINWYPVVKNTVYFALNHHPVSGWRDLSAVTVIGWSRWLELTRWCLSGKIGARLYLRSLRLAASGMLEGIRRGRPLRRDEDEAPQ